MINKIQITSLCHGMPGKKRPRLIRFFTVGNHETWRKCRKCKQYFDLRKETSPTCPNCGSTDIK